MSFLDPTGARRLLTQPAPDFALNYTPEAVDRVIALTNGQPYLIQLIGHALVTRFNRQSFEAGIERDRCFSLSDVDAVIATPEFFLQGRAYFSGVWSQAEEAHPAGQAAILRVLAGGAEGLDSTRLVQATGLAPDLVHAALNTLCAHDVVCADAGGYRFRVELMRRWVFETGGGEAMGKSPDNSGNIHP